MLVWATQRDPVKMGVGREGAGREQRGGKEGERKEQAKGEKEPGKERTRPILTAALSVPLATPGGQSQSWLLLPQDFLHNEQPAQRKHFFYSVQ